MASLKELEELAEKAINLVGNTNTASPEQKQEALERLRNQIEELTSSLK